MFEKLDMAPPDVILGLTEAFKKDPNPNKINLGVGVYKDSNGATPVFQAVKEAERRLIDVEKTKTYLSIEGSPEYAAAVQEMLFGAGNSLVTSGLAATAHTAGGTAALRVAADFIKTKCPGATVWLSDPTWPNHPAIFRASGLNMATYPYYDADAKVLAFDRMIEALAKIPAGDVVLLHACCHNPTGIDPDAAQWKQIAGVAKTAGWLPLFDFAYQGLGDGFREDARGLDCFVNLDGEMLIASSFSKNFGLYNERVGALTAVGASVEAVEKAMSHIKVCVRTLYSNPPAHGGAIVTTVLGDAALRAMWEAEVTEMRDRINGMRTLFVDTLKAKGVTRDFSFLTRQRGMFSFSGLTKDQVLKLRKDSAIYIVDSGRINVAGMTENNMEPLCKAIAAAL